jgi:hypothetical protein
MLASGNLMTLTFQVRRIPHGPRGEWASGIEDGGRFYPSIHFPSRLAAQRDAAAMSAALKANPQLADELHKLIRRRQ